MHLTDRTKLFLYYGVLGLIIGTSFLFYAPCNYGYYNSDHAIHVLMSKEFRLPRDFFYWGQNRLGSFLPMVAFSLHKLIQIHYLYLCSLIQYLFLLTGFLILSKELKSLLLKLSLCALIFLPVNEYNALILIGHPYSSQLFAGSLFLFFLSLFSKHLLKNNTFGPKQFTISLLLSMGASTFFIIGIWISEFNAVLILIPITYILYVKNLRDIVQLHYRKPLFIMLGVLCFSFFLLGWLFYKQVKLSAVTVADGIYDKAFIDNIGDLWRNIAFYLPKLSTALFFKDPFPLENFFNWFLIALAVLTIFIPGYFNKKNQLTKKPLLVKALLVVCIASSVALFCSTWNFRSHFCPRYFTPVYIIFCFALLLILNYYDYRKWITFSITALFLFFCFGYCYTYVIKEKLKNPFELYGEYRNLPKGILIGDYWDVHKINSVAIDNLKSLPFDHSTVRNWDWKDELLSENNFYFLNNHNTIKGGFGETILQFGLLFKYSGIKYVCNNTEVLLYHKFTTQPLTRFILKASNNQYLSMDTTNLMLTANQPDSTKAEIFQLIILRGGNALKASNGKFVCVDFGRSAMLFAESDRASGWEILQLISAGPTKINLISATGTYVSADQFKGNIIIADRDKALEWETFEFTLR